MKNKSKHTPMPWKLNKPEKDGRRIIEAKGDDFASNCVAELRYCSDADAAFIGRACNSHEDLLESLKAMVRLYEGYGYYIEEAKAAIAKAEGK